MELQLSARTLATFAIRLAKPKAAAVSDAAARHEGAIRALIVRAARVERASVPLDELENVLGLHGGTGAPLYVIAPVLQALRDALMGEEVTYTAQHVTHVKVLEAKRKSLPDLLFDTLVSGARAKLPIGMTFDATNPAAIAWAHDHAAELIKEISDHVQDAIRLTVVQSFEEGIAPRDVAKLIRSNIGLTDRDAGAVMKKQIAWLADGVAPEKATARAERYADKLLRSRADTIARTEGMRAANEGQRQLWDQAVDAGLVDAATQQKVWIATDDACPECQEVDGETVGLDEDFSVGSDPPLHPNCRCTIGLT